MAGCDLQALNRRPRAKGSGTRRKDKPRVFPDAGDRHDSNGGAIATTDAEPISSTTPLRLMANPRPIPGTRVSNDIVQGLPEVISPRPVYRRHQRYCSAPPCRRASKAASQARWIGKPGIRATSGSVARRPRPGLAVAQSRLLAQGATARDCILAGR